LLVTGELSLEAPCVVLGGATTSVTTSPSPSFFLRSELFRRPSPQPLEQSEFKWCQTQLCHTSQLALASRFTDMLTSGRPSSYIVSVVRQPRLTARLANLVTLCVSPGGSECVCLHDLARAPAHTLAHTHTCPHICMCRHTHTAYTHVVGQ
jgi:hypothetical protein